MATEADPKIQAADDDAAKQQQKVVFDDAQQTRVNELIQDAMGRAGREAKEAAAAAKRELETLRAQQAETVAELAKLREGKVKDGTPNPDLQAEVERIRETLEARASAAEQKAKAKEKEAQEAKDALLTSRKQVAMRDAASKFNFVDVSVATQLTQDKVRWDETRNRFVVLSETGSERMNASFEPMSLDEFYEEFASKSPYLVRGDVKPGSGSTESGRAGVSANGKYAVEDIFGPKSSSLKAHQLSKENMAEYRRLKVIAQEQGLIAKV